MTPLAHIKTAVMVVALGISGMLVPPVVSAEAAIYPYWIDDIKGAITFYRGDANYKKEYPNAKWDLYIDQMQAAYEKEDTGATYVAMNRFMDMLEGREESHPDSAGE